MRFRNALITGALLALALQRPALALDPREVAGACARQLSSTVQRLVRDRAPWDFGEDREREIAEWFAAQPADADPSELMRGYFDLFWQKRLEASFILTRWAAGGAIRKAWDQDSLFARWPGRWLGKRMGPHYQPLLNQIVIYPLDLDPAIRALVTTHESAHAFHRNQQPLTWFLYLKQMSMDVLHVLLKSPVTPVFLYRMESVAMGSQWEFARRIPRDVRERLIAKLTSMPLYTSTNVVRDFERSRAAVDLDGAVDPETMARLHAENLRREDHLDLLEAQDPDEANAEKFNAILVAITVESLRNAELTKEEFLRRQEPLHNYTLERIEKLHYIDGIPARMARVLFYGAVAGNYYLTGKVVLPTTGTGEDIAWIVRLLTGAH